MTIHTHNPSNQLLLMTIKSKTHKDSIEEPMHYCCCCGCQCCCSFVLVPFVVVESGQIVEMGDAFEIFREVEQLLVLVLVAKRFAECFDLEAIFGIHKKIATNIIEHDCILWRVLLENAPDDTQWFDLETKHRFGW